MSILITGGAGYIGSHVAKKLLVKGQDIIIIDNLSTGKFKTLETLQKIKKFEFIQLDLKKFDKVKKVFRIHQIETIIHFAASIIVPESVENPLKYYMNNTVNTINLISCAIEFGVKKFIFSSTAAVYGESDNMPEGGINEEFTARPINPYGQSKLMSEIIIKDIAKANKDLKFVIFRYFNVAGAEIYYADGKLNPRIGQSFPNATHLIKIASKCACNKQDKMYIFGENYPTFDGTCVRDYIHIDDLSDAHISAIDYLDDNDSDIFNCGYGNGYSVREIINTMKKVTGNDFKVLMGEPRAGDPSKLISNNNKIKSIMNWKPKYDNIDLICKSAFIWEKKLSE